MSVVPHRVGPSTLLLEKRCLTLGLYTLQSTQKGTWHAHPTWTATDCAHAVLRKGSPMTDPGESTVPAKITIPKHQLVFLRTQPRRIIFSLLRECLLPFQERTPVNLSNLLLGASHTTIPVKYKQQTSLCLTSNSL